MLSDITTSENTVHHHHHTVQVAVCACLFVCMLVNVLVVQGKTPMQVAQHQDHTGHKYKSRMQYQMQVAQGQDLH